MRNEDDVAPHGKDGVAFFAHKLREDQSTCECGAAVHASTLRVFSGMISDAESHLAMTAETGVAWRQASSFST